MYCDRCGKRIDDALNFCNSCGAQLKGNDNDIDRKSVLNSLVVALIVIATGGLGILAGIIAILFESVGKPEPVFVFALIYLAVLFGICFLILRQISKLLDLSSVGSGRRSKDPAPPVQLPRRNTARLEEFREPASVTDQTTRTLDKIPLSDS
jgi:hypothetical protein